MIDAMIMNELVQRDHRCACAKCDPSLVVMTQRQGDQHIGVRFWYDGSDQQISYNVDILFDGQPVTGVFEAILGERGTIWRYVDQPFGRHICETCRIKIIEMGIRQDLDAPLLYGVCTEKLHGRVEMRARAREMRQGCELGGDASHTHAQGICTGGRSTHGE